MDYSFLKNITLVDTGRVKPPKSLIPEGLVVRLHSSGAVYPSLELVNLLKLEYLPKTSGEPSFGLDIVDTDLWPIFKNMPRMLMFGVTAKAEKKVDLFSSCRYNEDGTPKSSVLSQGSISTTLLDLCRSMGWMTEEQRYVDLKVITEHPFKTADGLAFIPKVIEKGERKGERTYERREGITFYPVEPTDLASITPPATDEILHQESMELSGNITVTN